jgi:hypothetical protein
MKGSKKVLITTVAVIGLSVASISMVSAYGGPGGYGGCDRGGYSDRQQGPGQMQKGGPRGMDVDIEQRVADRLDMVKYKLRITEKQEPAWKEFTDTISKSAAAMSERRQQRNAEQTVTDRVKQMRDGAEQMTQVAAAIEKMYKTLTPEQQKIADQINPRRMRRF